VIGGGRWGLSVAWIHPPAPSPFSIVLILNGRHFYPRNDKNPPKMQYRYIFFLSGPFKIGHSIPVMDEPAHFNKWEQRLNRELDRNIRLWRETGVSIAVVKKNADADPTA
jgi:hypothetical protein